MTYSFEEHPLTADQRLWLEEVAKTPNMDQRVAKVKLLGQLSPDFHPSAIDPRFYSNGRLTLLGLWRVKREAALFQHLDLVIRDIRQQIIDRPGIDQILAEDVATRLKVQKELVEMALGRLIELGSFMSSGTSMTNPDGSQALVSMLLQNEDSYDEYLQYKDIGALLDRYYERAGRQFQRIPMNIGTIRPVNWSFLATDVGPAPAGYGLQNQEIRLNTAFVLMAIDGTKPELQDVLNAIKEECARFGIEAYRSDELQHSDTITTRVLQEIRECEYLIADLTYERPNVYYEIGYAHAHNKKPILYRKAGTSVHFDLSVHNIPPYANITELRSQLRQRLEAITGRKP